MSKFKQSLIVLEKLNNAGFEAYIVGGAVRDYFLEKETTDIDITTNARVEEICKIFNIKDSKALDYAGVTICFEGLNCEVTSYRKDLTYHDHRHPVVEYASTLKEDLKRRDFTINAIAMDKDYNIVDLYNGRRDINDKIIKCIGDPYIRFNEDALRVLRACYFASKLDFSIDEDIIKVIKENDFLGYLPKEYIKDMLEKIINFDSVKGLEYIVNLKLLKSFKFYQEIAFECLKYNVKSNYMYALFYGLNGFLPLDERLERKIINEGKLIGELVYHNFSKDILYESKGHFLEEAAYLYNKIYNKNINAKELYNNLPIHNLKDIDFDFSGIKNRTIVQKYVIKEIVNYRLDNRFDAISNYIKKRCFYE